MKSFSSWKMGQKSIIYYIFQTAHKFMKHNLVYKQLINVWNSTWSTNSSYKFMKYNFYKILQERDTNKMYEILRQTEFFYEIHLS